MDAPGELVFVRFCGAGQIAGLIEFGGGFSEGDISNYFQQLNLPVPRVEAVVTSMVL